MALPSSSIPGSKASGTYQSSSGQIVVIQQGSKSGKSWLQQAYERKSLKPGTYKIGNKKVVVTQTVAPLSFAPENQSVGIAVDYNQIEKFNKQNRDQGFTAGAYLAQLKADARGQKLVYVDKSQVSQFNADMRRQGINNAGEYLKILQGEPERQQPANILDASIPRTSFERAVNKQQNREQRMAQQDQAINSWLSTYIKGNSWLSRAGRSAAKAPYDMTVGFGQQVVSATEKSYLMNRALITGEGSGRKAVMQEFLRAGKETPGVVAKAIDPRTPEGFVNDILIIGGTYFGGRAIKNSKAKNITSKDFKPGSAAKKTFNNKQNIFGKVKTFVKSKQPKGYTYDRATGKLKYSVGSKKWINQNLAKVGLRKPQKIIGDAESLKVSKSFKGMQADQLKLLSNKRQLGEVMTVKEIKRLNKLEKINNKATIRAKARTEIINEQTARQTDHNTLRQRAISQAKKNTIKANNPLGSTTLRIKTPKGYYKSYDFDLTSSSGRSSYRKALLWQEGIKRKGINQKADAYMKVALEQTKNSKAKKGLLSFNRKGQQQSLLVQIEKPSVKITPPKVKKVAGLKYFSGGSLLIGSLKPKTKIYLPASSILAAGAVIKPKAKSSSKSLFNVKNLPAAKIDAISKSATLPKFDIRSLTIPSVIVGGASMAKTYVIPKYLQLQAQSTAQSYKPLNETPGLFKWPDFSGSGGGGGSRRWNGWFYGEHNRKFRDLNKFLGL